MNNIKYLIFEFHSDIFDASEKKIMFRKLRKNNFVLKDEFINSFLSSLIGKFFILGLTWSFSFQILSEIRHLIMDLGYGFELRTTKITGLIVIFGSIILTVVFYLIGKNFF